MFDKISIILNNNKEYMNKYIILEKKDWNNETKINFYYILLQYILKCPIYIYHINWLIKTKKFLINLLNNNNDLNEISNYLNNNNINDKIDTIIKKITDSEYYYNKFILNKNYSNKINGTNNNYLEFEFSNNSYKEEKKTNNQKNVIMIVSFEHILQKYLDSTFNLSDKIRKILSNYSITLNINKLEKKITYVNILYENNQSISFEEFENFVKIRQINNKIFSNYIHLLLFLDKIKNKVNNININNLELSIILKIKTTEENSGNNLDDICCEYIFLNLQN